MYSPENLTVSAGILKTNSDCFNYNNYYFTQSSFIMQYLLIYIRPDKLDLLFLISHFLDLGAGGRLLFITSLF